ncbi:MAG: inositol monophosphatase family protein [Psittacicella sp.]
MLLDSSFNSLLNEVYKIGEILLNYYKDSLDDKNNLQIEIKNDGTPVTQIDIAIDRLLIKAIEKVSSHLIITEESANTKIDFKKNPLYWLIDPIDGTKQFIKGQDEFAIMLSFMHYHNPIFTVVHSPSINRTYLMDKHKSYILSNSKFYKISPRKLNLDQKIRIAIGRNANLDEIKDILSQNFEYEFIKYGSSGLKAGLILENKADIYLSNGPTSEWDSASAQGLLEGVGGKLVNYKNNFLKYNKDKFKNPSFIAICDKEIDILKIIKQ